MPDVHENIVTHRWRSAGENIVDNTAFWKIIDCARSEADGEYDGIADSVHEQLVTLDAAEIESFEAILNSKLADAFTWKLWGAAYLMNGGCSDDGFEYFCGWLVVQGQELYEAALSDPDSLAKVADPESDAHEYEDILYAAPRAYEEVTGNEMPLQQRVLSRRSGERWDFDDAEATRQQLPELARKFDV